MSINNNINNISLKNNNSIKDINNNSQISKKQLEKLKQACADFEAIFYHIIFQSARKSIGNEGIVKKSQAEKIFTDMFDTEISKQIAYSSENGIKEMLFNYFTKAMNISKESRDIRLDVRG